MQDKLQDLKQKLIENLSRVVNTSEIEEIWRQYFGKDSEFQQIMQTLKTVEPEKKKEYGQLINAYKVELQELCNSKKANLGKKAKLAKQFSEKIDIELDTHEFLHGSIHPLNAIIEKFKSHFLAHGYEIVDGPEIESELYNFEMMNIPKTHPARNEKDTFYIDTTNLLRTHTSPVQARTMLAKQGKPIKIISTGKVYRRDDDDAVHSHQFMQLEGLVIGKKVSFANLIQTLKDFLAFVFERDVELRIRPSYFPFTKPSVEIDVLHHFKNGTVGFIEVAGAGMVHPNVLKMAGYDSDKVQGFAFGFGIERLAMIKYEIDEIREFYQNDARFLKQF